MYCEENIYLWRQYDEHSGYTKVAAEKNLSCEGIAYPTCPSGAVIDALKIVRSINLPSKEERIVTAYEQCKSFDPNNTALLRLGKLLMPVAS